MKDHLSAPLKDAVDHSQHLTLERFTSEHIQEKGPITVQNQVVEEHLPVQLITRIMCEYIQVFVL